MIKESMLNPADAVHKEIVPAGDYWMHKLKHGQTLRILDRAGKGNPPMAGDELPPDWKRGGETKKPGRQTTRQSAALRKLSRKKVSSVR